MINRNYDNLLFYKPKKMGDGNMVIFLLKMKNKSLCALSQEIGISHHTLRYKVFSAPSKKLGSKNNFTFSQAWKIADYLGEEIDTLFKIVPVGAYRYRRKR